MPAFVTSLYGTRPGVVAAVGFDQSLPIRITVGGGHGTSPILDPARFFALITTAGLQGSSGMGVTHSLNDCVRVYLYGERAHQARIGGLGFPILCNSPMNGAYGGADRLWTYYEVLRASNYRYPIRLSFGVGMVFYGMLGSMQMDWSDPTFGVTQFAMDFLVFPRVYPRNRFPVSYKPLFGLPTPSPAARPETEWIDRTAGSAFEKFGQSYDPEGEDFYTGDDTGFGPGFE